MWMDEIIRICLPFVGAFDLTDDNYRLLARRIFDAPQGHFCFLNPKIHMSPCYYFWLHNIVFKLFRTIVICILARVCFVN